METIKVYVEWCGKNLGGTFGDNVPGGVAFTARTFGELQKEAEDTLDFHVKGLVDDGKDVPQWLVEKQYVFSYDFKDMETILHAFSSFVSLAAISRACGINQGLLSHYANGIKKPSEKQRKRIVEGLHKIGRELQAVSI